MADANYIPQIDYTSRDYETIREDLLNLIPVVAPNWTNRDPADFGMALVELFSYMGDLMSYYIDRAANEGFLATASQRDSVLRIAEMLNYRPTESSPATVELTFTNTSAVAVTVPASTQVATTALIDGVSTQIIYETDTSVVVPAKASNIAGTANVFATQGYSVTDELLGTSNGNPNQVFKIAQEPVIINSLVVSVNGIRYMYAPALIESASYDPVFTTYSDSEGYTYVLFGDGVGGRIPPTSSAIVANYRVGAGSDGNVPANKITFMLTNAAAGLTVTNQDAAIGGADAESTDSIRTNATSALTALTRAVSLKDYAGLALQVPGVAKAVADAEIFSSVLLYVAPFGDPGTTELGETTPIFDELAARVVAFFVDKTPPNTSLTVLPPEYVSVDIRVTINLLPQYRPDAVTNQVLSALREIFNIANTFFADKIPLQYVLNAVSSVIGVDYAEVTLMRRSADQQVSAITNKALTGNIATLTTAATHGLTVGLQVEVREVGDPFDGTYVVTAVPTTSSFSYVKVHANVASTPVTPNGEARVVKVETIDCAVNEIPAEGTFTITAVGGIA